MSEKIYRVVDDDGNVYDNRTRWNANRSPRAFTDLSLAKRAKTKHQNSANWDGYHHSHGKTFRVQEAEVEWHDVAE